MDRAGTKQWSNGTFVYIEWYSLISVIITNPISKSTEEIACGSACGITDLITLITL